MIDFGEVIMMHNNYVKVILAGMVVGAVAGMVFDPLRSEKENAHLKKKAARMLKAAGQIVDNFTGL